MWLDSVLIFFLLCTVSVYVPCLWGISLSFSLGVRRPVTHVCMWNESLLKISGIIYCRKETFSKILTPTFPFLRFYTLFRCLCFQYFRDSGWKRHVQYVKKKRNQRTRFQRQCYMGKLPGKGIILQWNLGHMIVIRSGGEFLRQIIP